MCTRFFIDKSQEEIAPITELACRSPLARRFVAAGDPLKTDGEIRPADVVPVIAPDPRGRRSVYPMKWGFTVKEHGNLIFNARSESASSKPAFRGSWAARRCIVPASYYFEWKHYTQDGRTKTGEKYSIQPRGYDTAWLCGLYRIEDGFPVFVILTRDAAGDIQSIHDRMPVMLPQDMITPWVTPESDPTPIILRALTDMVAEKV